MKPYVQLMRDSTSANISTLGSILMKIFGETEIFAGYDEIKSILETKLSSSGAEGEKILRTLDLFSYGSYQDYLNGISQQTFMPLGNAQVLKLRQLSAITIVQNACQQKCSQIPLQSFKDPLGLNDTRAVEEILMTCIYERVISGKLCQKSQSLRISCRKGPAVQSRDVRQDQIPEMLAALKNFDSRVVESLRTIELEQQKAIQAADDETIEKARQTDARKVDATIGSLDISHGASSPASRRQKRSRGAAVAGLYKHGGDPL